MLEECGVRYDLIPVDLMKGAQMAPEFRALNPMGKVPVLIDGGERFSEAAAIEGVPGRSLGAGASGASAR